MTVRVRIAPAALAAGDLELTGAEHHYLARVRRGAAGDAVIVFDGHGRTADAVVVAITADASALRVGPVRAVAAPRPHLTSLVPLVKGDRLDRCVEKLVEVGADALVLYEAHHAVVRLDAERAATRRRRLDAVAAAAARQAGRAAAPEVVGPLPLADALAAAGPCDMRWVAVPGASRPPDASAAARLAILTGPEGGLTAEELAAAVAAGFSPVGLGPYVLRAETAPVVAAAYARIASAPRGADG